MTACSWAHPVHMLIRVRQGEGHSIKSFRRLSLSEISDMHQGGSEVSSARGTRAVPALKEAKSSKSK